MAAFAPTSTGTAPQHGWQGPAPNPHPAKFLVEYRNGGPQAPWTPFGETDDPAWAREILQACLNFFPSCKSRIIRRSVAAAKQPPG